MVTHNQQFEVHCYYISRPVTVYFADKKQAIDHANVVFEDDQCYKVKVWDLSLGPVEPNKPSAKALIYELV